MPSREDSAALLHEFERSARRIETPCGPGALVWRAWGSGPPLVLAHGSHGAWSHWIRNIGTLARERTVWVPDLPGYGDSAVVPMEEAPEMLRQWSENPAKFTKIMVQVS